MLASGVSACPSAAAAAQMAALASIFERRLERHGRLGRYTLQDVAKHCSPEDAWVVVDGKVYDITRHVLEHPGWQSGCSTSQLLAILRTLGTDCSEEVFMVHSKRALAQFTPFLIGVLVEEQQQQQESDSSDSSGSS